MLTYARRPFSFSYIGEMFSASKAGQAVEMPNDLALRMRDQGVVNLQPATPSVEPRAVDLDAEPVPVDGPAGEDGPVADAGVNRQRPRRARKG